MALGIHKPKGRSREWAAGQNGNATNRKDGMASVDQAARLPACRQTDDELRHWPGVCVRRSRHAEVMSASPWLERIADADKLEESYQVFRKDWAESLLLEQRQPGLSHNVRVPANSR